MLEHLQDTSRSLSKNWYIEELDNDIASAGGRLNKVQESIAVLREQHDKLRESFEHLSKVLEALAWVQEVLVLLDLEVQLNNKDDVEKELLRLKV